MLSASRVTASHGRHPLVVHSHLRWDFVWQRPQQILSRLARNRSVLYVEEPVFADSAGCGNLDVTQPTAGVYRVVPRLPGSLCESYDAAAVRVRTLLTDLIGESGMLAGMFDDAVQWFYTPMAAPIMVGSLGECAVVYDCMDELSQFRFAPSDLGARERQLMASAAVVFTGGRRLYEAKARLHDNVHFFGCGVDSDHFGLARHSDTVVPSDIVGLPKPVLGYFGVVDERLDYELIARLADSFPTGSLVFVGPTAKVDPAELPRQSNIHWLGQRPYDALPQCVKGFDVCLMPFALNEATEFINPTKTLEYMAAGKPIVSTAVADVVRNFTPIVRVAESIDEFVRHAESALEPDPDRTAEGIALARASSWEAIVAEMDRLVASAARARVAPKVELAPRPIRDHATAAHSGNRMAAAAASETASPSRSVSAGGNTSRAKRSNNRGDRSTDTR
jgi:glycosyltransferase involved in cell wall biosynthesis